MSPLVSVGMPVYNGDQYLEQALDSLLNQVYDNYQIIIVDNASTDRTFEIAKAYSFRSPKIKYHRNDQNIGAAANFNKAYALSEGDYFMWAAHDDWWAPSYISTCVDELERYPDSVLCYTDQLVKDGSREPTASHFRDVATSRMTVSQRYSSVCFRNWGLIYSVIRRPVMRDLELFSNYALTEGVLVASLAMKGSFRHVPQLLFLKREGKAWTRQQKKVAYGINSRVEELLKVDLLFLYAGFKYITIAVLPSAIRPIDKLVCTLITIRNYLGMKALRYSAIKRFGSIFLDPANRRSLDS